LSFAELSLRAPWPKPATLRKQRASLPEGYELALRVPRRALSSSRGALRFDAELESAVQAVLEAQAALQARFLVLPTPVDLTPGARSRDLLAAYVERLPRSEALTVVWAPHGAWENEQAAALASTLGVVLAFDPLEDPCPEGPLCYARLVAIGARRSFSPASLERVVDALGEQQRPSYVVFESERSFSQASALARLASGEPGDDPWA
jgi:uncharacterized protein YecE (DUF72 family)